MLHQIPQDAATWNQNNRSNFVRKDYILRFVPLTLFDISGKRKRSNTSNNKLCINCSKSYVAIYIIMSDNARNKTYQLKLNN